ncbi:hypothetical protein C1H46_024552 [Malus baccata]|uniref:Uncharacterized protein n=1 Tax=Malus baccata TaxID=106549 RepID=A0A540LTT2_MALBA|nr:hypothetical protein C1H46_024552 [Malus baccata]
MATESVKDQFSPVAYIPFLLFYPNVVSTTTSNVSTHSVKAINERYQHLIKSLSEILTHYYPLAGRIKGNVVIVCNDDGAEFVKTHVKCSLSEILEHRDAEMLRRLLPIEPESTEAVTGKLLAVQVNGNHETINVEGDFRFVDTGGFDECLDFLEYLDDNRDDWEEAFVGWVGVSKRMKEERKTPQNYWDPWNLVRVLKSTVSLIILFPSLFRNVSSDKVFRILGQKQKGVIARSILLRPGGPLACELARHAVVLKVNDWVFCHGGLVPQHVAYGVERMNREVSDWMRGLVESDDNASLSSPPSPPRDVTV